METSADPTVALSAENPQVFRAVFYEGELLTELMGRPLYRTSSEAKLSFYIAPGKVS
jgi:hypothetical protein